MKFCAGVPACDANLCKDYVDNKIPPHNIFGACKLRTLRPELLTFTAPTFAAGDR